VFVTDPFTFSTIAKEPRKLNFRAMFNSVVKKLFDVDPIESVHSIFPKHLQVVGCFLDFFKHQLVKKSNLLCTAFETEVNKAYGIRNAFR